MSLTFDQNWNDQIESHAGCCGVDCRNPEIELIPASEAVAVKLWVFPPLGCVSSITTKRWTAALLTGICVGVRMGAHEPTVHLFLKDTFYFKTFFGFHVHVCVHVWLIWLMWGVCTWSDVYFIVSRGNNFLRDRLCAAMCADQMLVEYFKQCAWCKCVCLQHASFGSAGGLYLWITFLCVCVGGWVYLYGWIIPYIMGPICVCACWAMHLHTCGSIYELSFDTFMLACTLI